MFDLTKKWPLGLDTHRWPWFVGFVVVVLAILSQVDVWASQGSIGWPDAWREPFFLITDYGRSEWILFPTLLVTLVALVARQFLGRLQRLVAGEIALVSAFIFLGVAAPGLLSNLIKRAVGRSRPIEFDAHGAFAFEPVLNDWMYQSFPSGHTTTAIALAFVIGFLWPRLFGWLLALGIIVGISRVPVGMHYPTDVFAGFITGMLGAYGVRNYFASRGWLFRRRADGHIVRRRLSALRFLVTGRGRNDPSRQPDRP